MQGGVVNDHHVGEVTAIPREQLREVELRGGDDFVAAFQGQVVQHRLYHRPARPGFHEHRYDRKVTFSMLMREVTFMRGGGLRSRLPSMGLRQRAGYANMFE